MWGNCYVAVAYIYIVSNRTSSCIIAVCTDTSLKESQVRAAQAAIVWHELVLLLTT